MTTMTKESLAALLNGREYRDEITHSEEDAAKAAGLVVVFGGSDDLCELRGAITDERDCYNGGSMKIKGKLLKMLWCKEPGYSWTYSTNIPHAVFDIMEDGEKYCRGIVFAIADLPA